MGRLRRGSLKANNQRHGFAFYLRRPCRQCLVFAQMTQLLRPFMLREDARKKGCCSQNIRKYNRPQKQTSAGFSFFFFILPLPRNITKIGGMFTEKEKVIGVIDITSGGILITDAVWASALPVTTDSSLTLGLDIPAGKIPVLSMMRGGKRLLVIDVDGVWKNTAMVENVTVENPLTNEEVEKW